MDLFTNTIVVGGPIAAGKSSLVGSLPFIPVQELDPNDELQKILLSKLYEGDMIAAQVFQLDMMLSRFDKYKNASESDEIHVFDRMIFEDKLFAFMLFGHLENVWEYYDSIWKDKVNELIKEIGKPKLYILLSISWDTFEKRIFERNRHVEIDNFEKNRPYFNKLISMYDSYVINMLEEYDIPFAVIDTNNLSKMDVVNKTKEMLEQRGII
ncbi:MAG: deoxynucleoside kinase [Mycoplasmatales bacterium]|nr:deoxynucleoside kinase [Mycoplasmatales bacterium]